MTLSSTFPIISPFNIGVFGLASDSHRRHGPAVAAFEECGAIRVALILTLSLNAGRERNLAAAPEGRDLKADLFELSPPPPPAGMFAARFGSDRALGSA